MGMPTDRAAEQRVNQLDSPTKPGPKYPSIIPNPLKTLHISCLLAKPMHRVQAEWQTVPGRAPNVYMRPCAWKLLQEIHTAELGWSGGMAGYTPCLCPFSITLPHRSQTHS